MERSSVVDSETTEGKVDQIRTSTGTFLAPGFDPIVSAIEHRLAQLVMLPVENQEAMQVLHYAVRGENCLRKACAGRQRLAGRQSKLLRQCQSSVALSHTGG